MVPTKPAKKPAKASKKASAKGAKAAKPRARKVPAVQPEAEPALPDGAEVEIHADHHAGHGHEGHGHDGHAHDGHGHDGHAHGDDGHAGGRTVTDVAATEASQDEGLEEAADKPDGPVALPDDDWAAKLTAARSKPVQLADDASDAAPARGRSGAAHANGSATLLERADTEHADATQVGTAHASSRPAALASGWDGMSLPEQFLLVTLGPGWDDRMERARPGAHGAAIVGSLLLDLAVRGKLRIRQDRFEVPEGDVGDRDLEAIAARVRQMGNLPSAQAQERLAKRLTDTIRPWKQRLERRGLVEERRRKHLGIFPRSDTFLLDEDAQTTLQNRLMRTLAGSGTPDSQVVALLGLLDASGVLPQLVPASALEFNRKRIRHLLTGRDPMGYAVDPNLRANVQEACVQTVLRNVRSVQNP